MTTRRASMPRPLRAAVLPSLLASLLAALSIDAAAQLNPSMTAPPVKAVVAEKFQRLYPGRYTAREQALVQQYLADNAALKARGPIDAARLV